MRYRSESIVELSARARDAEVDAKQPINAYVEAPRLPCGTGALWRQKHRMHLLSQQKFQHSSMLYFS